MYGKTLGTGVIGGGAALPVTGFYTGSAVILAFVLLIAGGVLIRISYLKRTAASNR